MTLDSEGIHLIGSNLYGSTPAVETPILFQTKPRLWVEALCKEIELDIDHWASFPLYNPETEADSIRENKEELLDMVSELRHLINDWQHDDYGELFVEDESFLCLIPPITSGHPAKRVGAR